jgi:copper(I)-binding protein
MTKSIISALLITALSMPAFAQVSVTDPWVRATVAQQKATGAFMSITSAQGGRLVEVKSPVAGIIEIHEMKMENDVMKMRAIDGLDLPAGKPVALGPNGYHVMLIDLKRPMLTGESVPLTLVVEGKDKKRENIEIKAVVRPLTSNAQKGAHSHSH